MNLVLDFGNTRIKAGFFKGNELLNTAVFDSQAELLSSTLISSEIKNCLIASVTNDHKSILQAFSTKFSTQVFTTSSRIPLKNLYKSVLTLGSDRIAASVGAFCFFPNKNVLTIDAGTCIKFNFVNAKNEYLGGAISPGINMRLKAMHHYTSALPMVEMDPTFEQLIGRNTNESLLSGAITAAACEADGMIQRYMEHYSELQVVITGGDADYLCKQVKNRFFTNQNILLHGLNSILNLNIET